MSIDWVCPECGLDYHHVSPQDIVLAARTFPRRYRSVLTHFDADEDPDALIRHQPGAGVWSALEYTAHVADMLDLLASQVRRIEVEDDPRLNEFDPDERAEEEEYNSESLLEVLGRLETGCADLSSTVEFMDPGAWARTGHYDHGQREAIDVARNALHEASHHFRDVMKVLTAARGRPTAER